MIYKLKIHIEEIDEYSGKSEHYEPSQIGPDFKSAVDLHRWFDRLRALVRENLLERRKEKPHATGNES